MNQSTLLKLIDDPDSDVEEQLTHYYHHDISVEKVIEFESIYDQVSPARFQFYHELRRSIKIEWFGQLLKQIILRPSIDNTTEIELLLLAMNGLMPTLHSTFKSKNNLDMLSEEIGDELQTIYEPTEKLLTISRILFYKYQFSGNTKAYYDIENSNFSHVLDMKKGIPISLSILTYLICKRNLIKCIPANIPRHFMLYFPTEQSLYMDCFNAGNLLTSNDLNDFLNHLHVNLPIESFHETNFLVILKRWFQNMSYIYSTQHDNQSELRIQPFVDLINQQLS